MSCIIYLLKTGQNKCRMKNVWILVAAFLVGSTTQSIAQNRHNDDQMVLRNGNHQKNEVRFVENGVLYEVATNGSFNFKTKRILPNNYYGRRNHNVTYYPTSPGAVQYVGSREDTPRVVTDRFGNIRSIGSTYITYKNNGKVKTIGDVKLQYYRGKLIQVGAMKLVYNRFGEIRDTFGTIDHSENQVWHDDWIYDYDNDNDWKQQNRRSQKNIRKRKVKL